MSLNPFLRDILRDDCSDIDACTQALLSASSAIVSAAPPEPHRGSVPGRAPNLPRRVQQADDDLEELYFGPHAVYGDDDFRAAVRIPRTMFIELESALETHGYLTHGRDAAGLRGASVRLKLWVVLRYLGQGQSCKSLESNYRLSKSTIHACVKNVCVGIVRIYGSKWLHMQGPEHVQSTAAEYERQGFPGLLGCIDCMHWLWDNCPLAHAGQYKGKEKKPSIVLEAVADRNLYIWHSFFGVAGANNDVNVLDKSPLLFLATNDDSIFNIEYTVNGNRYDTGYLLSDGIYPQLSILIKAYRQPTTPQETHFNRRVGSVRKDVERAFGVMQGQWHIVKYPARVAGVEHMVWIMQTCIILHNMLVHARVIGRGTTPFVRGADAWGRWRGAALDLAGAQDSTAFSDRLMRMHLVTSQALHVRLRTHLQEHMWQRNQAGRALIGSSDSDSDR
eukprot:GHVU01092383.1.p1 GENE.GHVU01092383.1~~GHVU01092383.1.p1  ORF type:complete len:448 (-),score=38.68 GHVU01092383.1:79-1422(-)